MRPRIRTLKPEIHLDEELWDLEEETGFPIFRAFTGIINHADREGRFEWRPRALKAGILPYWDGDFSRVLHALATRGFLVHYACGGREYGALRTFSRHQSINNREAPSEIPSPDDDGAETVTTPDASTRAPRVPHASPTPLVHARVEGKGREGKGREGNNASGARDLRVDFSRRYESARGGLTWPSGRHDRQTTDLAGWLRANPSVDRGVMLDNFFADSWAESKGFPFGALAKDPAKYAVPPKPADPAAVAAAAEAELREAERRAYEDMGGEIKL